MFSLTFYSSTTKKINILYIIYKRGKKVAIIVFLSEYY